MYSNVGLAESSFPPWRLQDLQSTRTVSPHFISLCVSHTISRMCDVFVSGLANFFSNLFVGDVEKFEAFQPDIPNRTFGNRNQSN